LSETGKIKSNERRLMNGEGSHRKTKERYRFLWKWVVIGTSLVACTPLVILTLLNYYQYLSTITSEAEHRAYMLTSLTKRSIGFFLDERQHSLNFISSERSVEELKNPEILGSIFSNLNEVLGGMVDIGFIDQTGKQIAYVGPYELQETDYSDQDWFHEVKLRGHYVSDVFMGFRNFPHIVIAVAIPSPTGKPFVLRATIDSAILDEQLRNLDIEAPSEAYIINKNGVLQTPSEKLGRVLGHSGIDAPPFSMKTTVLERIDSEGIRTVLGYAYIPHTPFILIIDTHPTVFMKTWFSSKRNLWLFLFSSMTVILLITTGSSYYLVSRIRVADEMRAKVLHNVEYTNKMASIGRLASGVAHEINNPLAIINEKAGLMKDIADHSGDYPLKEKNLASVDSIIKSVERCSRITRRLLGFAKHIDVQSETIGPEHLIKEVFSFLGREAEFHNITIDLAAEDDVQSIVSDRGQLQQVFLNLINNSINALSEAKAENGRIQVNVKSDGSDYVSVIVEDNGPGITPEHLRHIFEPFFTTRDRGTGLGLSVTYGIVQKLGGDISVQSTHGKGTKFTVTLPVNSGEPGE
jgi:two-component system, NtrC family, sensor kinase